jgi:flagellar motor switch protein FliN
VGADASASPLSFEDPIVWEQSVSFVEGPALWIVAGRDLWEIVGRVTLEAAGIDAVTEEDCRSTWQELINQTVSGFIGGIAADRMKDLAQSGGGEIPAEPSGLTWLTFSVAGIDADPRFVKVAWIAELAAAGEPHPDDHAVSTGQNGISRTFDLLLDVALPVSVSFGRTTLQIREVLKLNTGSIVELDRLVSDPVEVVVNDCVIARGEVVVVDGNYGVRISHLASREDRLRSGLSESRKLTGMSL